MCLAPVIRPKGPGPKEQESLAQGLPWVSRYKRFALKGLEMRTRSGRKVRTRFSPHLVVLSGLTGWWELTQGRPWATLSWPLRATEWKHPTSFGPCEAKHIPRQVGSVSNDMATENRTGHSPDEC
jgi:hypothetical protein